MDVFEELQTDLQDPGMDKFFKDLEVMWGVKKWYRRPTHKEAAFIWDACGFHSRVTESMIESGLWEWATQSQILHKKDDSYTVSWKFDTFTFVASWSAFYKWFLCALGAPGK